jgi:RNA polymerase sigma-70 factor (ECF subfamily)
LLRRIRDPGDTEAWQTFLDVYGPLIYRHGRGRGLQDADAAEVTQEVLLQISRSIGRFEYDPARGRFRDWLGTVTRNKIRRFFRKQAGAIASPSDADEEEALAGAVGAEQDTEWTEAFNVHLLEIALTRIRPHFEEDTWRAFELVWRDGQAPAEAARQLGRKIGWVYLAKCRVLKSLEEVVQELAEDLPLYLR